MRLACRHTDAWIADKKVCAENARCLLATRHVAHEQIV